MAAEKRIAHAREQQRWALFTGARAVPPHPLNLEDVLAYINTMDQSAAGEAFHVLFPECRGNRGNMDRAVRAYADAGHLSLFARCITQDAYWDRVSLSDESILILLNALYREIAPLIKREQRMAGSKAWRALNQLLNKVDPTDALITGVTTAWSQRLFAELATVQAPSAFHRVWQIKMLTKLLAAQPGCQGYAEALKKLTLPVVAPITVQAVVEPDAAAMHIEVEPSLPLAAPPVGVHAPVVPMIFSTAYGVAATRVDRGVAPVAAVAHDAPVEVQAKNRVLDQAASLAARGSQVFAAVHGECSPGGLVVVPSSRPIPMHAPISAPPDLSRISFLLQIVQTCLHSVEGARTCLVGGRAERYFKEEDWAAPIHGDFDLALYGKGGDLISRVRHALQIPTLKHYVRSFEEHEAPDHSQATFIIRLVDGIHVDLCIVPMTEKSIELEIERSMKNRCIIGRERHIDLAGQDRPQKHWYMGRECALIEMKESRAPQEWAYLLLQYHLRPAVFSDALKNHLASCPLALRADVAAQYNKLRVRKMAEHPGLSLKKYDPDTSWPACVGEKLIEQADASQLGLGV